MPERLVWLDARLGVVIQHSADQVDEHRVVRRRVALLVQPLAAWAARLCANDLGER